jgi:hypothetical protein
MKMSADVMCSRVIRLCGKSMIEVDLYVRSWEKSKTFNQRKEVWKKPLRIARFTVVPKLFGVTHSRIPKDPYGFNEEHYKREPDAE